LDGLLAAGAISGEAAHHEGSNSLGIPYVAWWRARNSLRV